MHDGMEQVAEMFGNSTAMGQICWKFGLKVRWELCDDSIIVCVQSKATTAILFCAAVPRRHNIEAAKATCVLIFIQFDIQSFITNTLPIQVNYSSSNGIVIVSFGAQFLFAIRLRADQIIVQK